MTHAGDEERILGRAVAGTRRSHSTEPERSGHNRRRNPMKTLNLAAITALLLAWLGSAHAAEPVHVTYGYHPVLDRWLERRDHQAQEAAREVPAAGQHREVRSPPDRPAHGQRAAWPTRCRSAPWATCLRWSRRRSARSPTSASSPPRCSATARTATRSWRPPTPPILRASRKPASGFPENPLPCTAARARTASSMR